MLIAASPHSSLKTKLGYNSPAKFTSRNSPSKEAHIDSHCT
jgi:hypothetical protein